MTTDRRGFFGALVAVALAPFLGAKIERGWRLVNIGGEDYWFHTDEDASLFTWDGQEIRKWQAKTRPWVDAYEDRKIQYIERHSEMNGVHGSANVYVDGKFLRRETF